MTLSRYDAPAGVEMKPSSKGLFYLAAEVDKKIAELEAAWLNAEAEIEELKRKETNNAK